MDPFFPHFISRKVLLLYLVLFLFCSIILSTSSDNSFLEKKQFLVRRRMLLEMEENVLEIQPPKKKSSTNLSIKNQTKLIKSNLSSKNQTNKLSENSSLSKNQTKISSKSTNSIKISTSLSKNELKKQNNTLISQLKKLNNISLQKKLNSTSKNNNSTKLLSSLSKKTSDLLKLSSPKNKTTKAKDTQNLIDQKNITNESQSKQTKTQEKKPNIKKPSSEINPMLKKSSSSSTTTTTKQKKQPSWLDQEIEDDLVSEFRDLPSKFQQTLLPDIEKISLTSKKYFSKANKEMTQNFKPIVGHKYASTIATIVSFVLITIPLLLVSLVFNRIKAYFSIQKIVIFIQVYLSIYFSILCLSSLVTGLEPLRFFYATSQSTYICLMVLQTLGYVLYLLLLLLYFILVFSTDSGLGSKVLGLGQIVVGFAIGLHFYVAVFHRVVLHQPPKTNWKVHGIYAICFLVICLLSKFDRRKKAYLEEGGEEGKKN